MSENALPSLWIVLDAGGRPEVAAGWRDAAHDHIKDAIEIEVDETASRWVVREYAPAEELTRLRAEVEALRADAERYVWLREQHWFDSPICVVVNPKMQLLLGTHCPFGEKLDEKIDAARAAQGE